MALRAWVRRKVTDHTPGIGRVFLICGAKSVAGCGRVVPYYRVYGKGKNKTLGCPHCGQSYYRPAQIPEWRAALWLLWGWISKNGDPRMPIDRVTSPYA